MMGRNRLMSMLLQGQQPQPQIPPPNVDQEMIDRLLFPEPDKNELLLAMLQGKKRLPYESATVGTRG